MIFRKLAELRKAEYNALLSYNDKHTLAKEVYFTIRQRGGRFLKLVHTNKGFPARDVVRKGLWQEASTKTAIEKCKQLLREKKSPARRGQAEILPYEETSTKRDKELSFTRCSNGSYCSSWSVLCSLWHCEPGCGPHASIGTCSSKDTSSSIHSSRFLSFLQGNDQTINSALLKKHVLLRERQMPDTIHSLCHQSLHGILPPPLGNSAGYRSPLVDNETLQALLLLLLEHIVENQNLAKPDWNKYYCCVNVPNKQLPA